MREAQHGVSASAEVRDTVADDCVVRRIGGRKSHPGFHRVLTNTTIHTSGRQGDAISWRHTPHAPRIYLATAIDRHVVMGGIGERGSILMPLGTLCDLQRWTPLHWPGPP
jgi:hypothetical protein